MRNQAGNKGEDIKAKADMYTGEATVRQNQKVRKEETEGQVAGSQTEADERKRKRDGKYLKETLSKHLRNSCGSESGKGERKQTVGTSTRSWKECMRNQAGNKVEDVRSESGLRALRKSL